MKSLMTPLRLAFISMLVMVLGTTVAVSFGLYWLLMLSGIQFGLCLIGALGWLFRNIVQKDSEKASA